MRYLLTIFFLSFAGFLSAAPIALPPPVIPQCFGVGPVLGTATDAVLDRWEDSGYGWVAMALPWAGIEKTKNVYDFTGTDALLVRLTMHHLKPLFILDSVNPLYPPGQAVSEAYVRFLTAAVRRYHGKPLLWEIGPSVSARQTAQTIKAADPEAPVILGVSQDTLQTDLDPTLLTDTDAVMLSTDALSAPEDAADIYETARRLIQTNAPPGRQIPVLVSAGVETSPSDVTRRWLFDLASGVRLSLSDEETGDLSSPVSQAVRTLTRTLDGFRFIKRIPLAASEDYLLLFSNGKDRLRIAAWTAGSGHAILLPIPAVNSIIDQNGVSITPVLADGRLSLTLTGGPEYLDVSGDAALRQAGSWTAVPQNAFSSAGQSLRLALTYHNPDPVSHRIRFVALMTAADGMRTPVPGGEDIVPPDRPLTLGVQAPPLAGTPAQVRVGLMIDGVRQPYPQDVGFTALAPLTLSVAPLTPTQVQVQITNPGRDAFAGRLNAATPTGIVTLKINLKAGTSTALVTVPLIPATDAAWRLRDDQGHLAATLPTQRLVPCPTSLAAGQTSQSGSLAVHSAHYQLAAGETSWQISEEQPLPLPGKPSRYGIWIFGDRSSSRISVGFGDSAGQTFHTDGPVLDWTGWRFVTFSLRPVGETWKYPLQINDLLRVRTLSNPAPRLGVLLWKGPTIIYETDTPVHGV